MQEMMNDTAELIMKVNNGDNLPVVDFHSVVLRLVLTAVEQLFFHSCPHTFTACIIMTSSAGTVHALNDPIFLYSSIPASFLCCNARYIRFLP